MTRDMSMVVGLMCHGFVISKGRAPGALEVKTFFDAAELCLKESMSREPAWRAMEFDHEEKMRKLREAEGRR